MRHFETAFYLLRHFLSLKIFISILFNYSFFSLSLSHVYFLHYIIKYNNVKVTIINKYVNKLQSLWGSLPQHFILCILDMIIFYFGIMLNV